MLYNDVSMVMGLVFIANSLNELMSSRAWIIPPLPLILGQIVSQIIGILVCDVSTTAGVIILIAFPYGTMIFLRSIYALIVLSSLGRSEGQTSPPTADEQGN